MGVFHGFIVEEVDAVMENLGATDFAGIVREETEDGSPWLGLRYEQFIAPLVKAVQELSCKVASLEDKIK